MNLAVLTYEFATENPDNVPTDWVCEVIELGESTTLPGENWVLMTPEELVTYKAAHQDAYNTWLVTKKTAEATIKTIESTVSKAAAFGNSVIKEFTTENVLLQITQAGMTATVRRNTAEIRDCLTTGSLYDAMIVIRNFPEENKDEQFITNARLLQVLNKIEVYLGLTPSPTL